MSDLDVLLPSFPSPVLTIAEDTSFLEVSIGDPRGVPLPSTMAVARTVSAQEHLAVQGSHHEETAGAERDLRKAGSPTSSTKSFMLHVTAYSRPLHGSEEKLGKSCCVCVSSLMPVPSPLAGHRRMVSIGQQPRPCSVCASTSLDLQR